MNYHGTNIIRDLREANEIVIYGHADLSLVKP